MKINSVRTSRFRNAEHYQFQSEFEELVIRCTAAALTIETLFTSFQAALAEEGIAMNVIQKSAITEELVEADIERDQIFRGFYELTKSGTKHYNPDVRQAANRVMLVIEGFGNISNKPYNEETAIISTVIQKLRNEFTGDLSSINASEWINVLETKNNAFDELAKSRYTAEAGKTSLRMKEVRLDVDMAFRKIVQLVNALILVNGEASYTEFVNELNERILKFNTTLAIREGRMAAQN